MSILYYEHGEKTESKTRKSDKQKGKGDHGRQNIIYYGRRKMIFFFISILYYEHGEKTESE